MDKDPAPLVVDPLPASVVGSVTVSGTSEYGAAVEVAVSCAGRVHSHRQVAGAGGRFSLSVTLYVGDNLISVKATDRAGNLTLAGPYAVRGLAPPPAAPPVVPPVAVPAPEPPVLEALPGVVHEASLVLEGTATAGGTVEVRLNGEVVGTAAVSPDGRFRFAVTLREGLNMVQVRVRTAAGWSEYGDARLVRHVVLREMKDIAGHWAEGAIKKAVGMGIVAGYEDGTFRPDKRVLRMEFAKIVAVALDLNVFAAAEPVEYLDWTRVPAWARSYIAACVRAGLIQGYTTRPLPPGTRSLVRRSPPSWCEPWAWNPWPGRECMSGCLSEMTIRYLSGRSDTWRWPLSGAFSRGPKDCPGPAILPPGQRP
ncbi:MAG: S-layer homology domain-containing protein [Bacillota bacterium]|nr:S-layer homology domain-containing protein [Bacillota bacterium]